MYTSTIDIKSKAGIISPAENDGKLQGEFYDIFLNHMIAIAQELPSGEKYTVKELYGSDAWVLLSKGQRLEVGRLMAYMVSKRLIPYEYAGKLNNNHIVYRVIR